LSEPVEGSWQLIEWKDVVNQRSRASLVQKLHGCIPCLTALLIRIRSNSDATNSNSPEK
jgi:hypothetical protein